MSRVPVNDIPVLFEPIGKLSSTHCLAGARSLHKPTRKGCLVKIMNPMPAPFTVYNNQVLGKLFPITDIRACDFDLLDGPQVNSVGTESKSDAEYIQIAKDLGIDVGNSNLSPDDQNKLLIFLGKNADVFATSSSDIGCTNVYQHRIDTGDHAPFRQKPYRQTPAGRERVNEHVQQMLDDGVIVESDSTWAAPVVMIKKKDNTFRFAVDFRGLNARTVPMNFPIPDLQDALDSIGTSQSKIFSTMDLKSSFWQIPLDLETAHKTTFVTHDNAYLFTRVLYGITSGPM